MPKDKVFTVSLPIRSTIIFSVSEAEPPKKIVVSQLPMEETWIERLSLSEAMKRLNAREYEIISLRFFEGRTQMEVADAIGISQAQVPRLEKNALRTMRSYLTA